MSIKVSKYKIHRNRVYIGQKPDEFYYGHSGELFPDRFSIPFYIVGDIKTSDRLVEEIKAGLNFNTTLRGKIIDKLSAESFLDVLFDKHIDNPKFCLEELLDSVL